MRKFISLAAFGALSKHIAGTRPLNNKERRGFILMLYSLTIMVGYYQWRAFRAETLADERILASQSTYHGRPPLDTSECGPGDDVCERDPVSGEILMCANDYHRANMLSRPT